MKANELMIRDWVANPINGKPMRVMSLTRDVELGLSGFYDEVNPIPLTEDILDKNFKDIAEPHQRIYGGRWVYYDEYIEIEITEYTDGIWQVVVDEIEMSGLPTWEMYVSDVHQLQHAMRLCNIEKEIEL